MTDNEIIKALEKWLKQICDSYQTSLDLGCVAIATDTEEYMCLLRGTLDFINRQKAENEQLYKTLDYRAENIRKLEQEIKRLKYLLMIQTTL